MHHRRYLWVERRSKQTPILKLMTQRFAWRAFSYSALLYKQDRHFLENFETEFYRDQRFKKRFFELLFAGHSVFIQHPGPSNPPVVVTQSD